MSYTCVSTTSSASASKPETAARRSAEAGLEISLSPAAVRLAAVGLLVAAVLFVAATAASDLGIHFRGLARFDLKEERNFAVWFSSILLALNAALAYVLAGRERQPRSHRCAWLLAGCAFACLSADEVAGVHEFCGVVAGRYLHQFPRLADILPQGSFVWVVLALPGVLAFVALLVWMSRALLAVVPRSRKFALAATGCWLGVIAAEVVESLLERAHLPRSLEGAVEEGLELAGSLLFLIALTAYHRHVTRLPEPAEEPRPKVRAAGASC